MQYEDLLSLKEARNKLTILIDNKETIKRSSVKQERMNISEMLVPEFDIEQLIWDLKQLLPMQITFEWVKSHQDITKEGKQIFGLFPRKVQLNCEVDKLAARGVMINPPPRAVYTHTVAALYDSNKKQVTNTSQYLYQWINGPKTREYIGRKCNWENEELDSIDWHALGQAMKSYTQFQKSKAIQLMYDWQNDGAQKNLFQQAEGKCPGCGEYETHMHYLDCSYSKMQEARKGALRALSTGLRSINTYPGGIALILQGIQTSFKEAVRQSGFPTSYKDALLHKATSNQYNLGHQAMQKGFIVKSWEIMQREWCRENGVRHNPTKWSRKVVILLHNYSKTLWKARNQVLHGENSSKAIEIRKAKCKERIKVLYKVNRKHLTSPDKKLFNLPLQYRVKGSIAGMTLWIDRAEMVFQHALQKEEMKQETLITWWFPKSQKWKKQTSSDPG